MSRYSLICGHKTERVNLRCNPIVVTATLYAQGESYAVDSLQINATFGEDELRDKLFDKENGNLIKYVTVLCPECSKEVALDKIVVEHNCRRCGKYNDVTFCKHNGMHFCKRCISQHCESCAKANK